MVVVEVIKLTIAESNKSEADSFLFAWCTWNFKPEALKYKQSPTYDWGISKRLNLGINHSSKANLKCKRTGFIQPLLRVGQQL